MPRNNVLIMKRLEHNNGITFEWLVLIMYNISGTPTFYTPNRDKNKKTQKQI